MNRRSQILNELSGISIHLQYMPTNLDESEKNRKYFDYFEKAISLRHELLNLDDKKVV